MTTLKDLTSAQLQRIIDIKQQIESLQSQLDSIAGDGANEIPAASDEAKPPRKKYKMSPAHRRNLLKALAKARAARWAKSKTQSEPAVKKKRRLSAAGRAAIIAATKARWARIKGTAATSTGKPAKKRKMSAEGRARIAAAAKARWAKAKAEGKTRL